MKIAVSSAGNGMDALLDQRFGRCRFFVVVNTENMHLEAFENENAGLSGGAGIQAAQFLAAKGVEAVVTGNCGPNAVQTLNAAGIALYTGQSGRVVDLVERFKQGLVSPTTQANAPSHAGTDAGTPEFDGTGMGRGQCVGGGRSRYGRRSRHGWRSGHGGAPALMPGLRFEKKVPQQMDKIDVFLNNLQEQIFDETKRAYGESGFQRWRNPLYRGTMENPDGYARITGKCGDTMEMFLRFRDGHVQSALYTTDGCGSSNVCGSFAAELAMGRDPDGLAEITGADVLQKVGRFPEEEAHCADLAAETLQAALHAYMAGGKGDW